MDRTGNRRFAPILTHAERIEKHILEDEEESRAYIEQLWAEAMVIFRSGDFSLKFSQSIEEYLMELQENFMPEDTDIGLIEPGLRIRMNIRFAVSCYIMRRLIRKANRRNMR